MDKNEEKAPQRADAPKTLRNEQMAAICIVETFTPKSIQV